MSQSPPPPELPTFASPYSWPDVDAAVSTTGGAILAQFVPEQQRRALNDQIDAYLQTRYQPAGPETGSDGYDDFLGHQTVRLHGLVAKFPLTADLIGHPELVSWATRHLSPGGEAVTLNAGELIQIEPGEARQQAHRDSDSWPVAQVGEHPIVVNAIVALDAFTTTNGATYIAPHSWEWDQSRRARPDDYTRAVMGAGDALLFRGDVIHRGGENLSPDPRRALSISYCAGWLRPVENSFLNVPIAAVASLPTELQAVLGYRTHDSTHDGGGLLGLYENGDPGNALPTPG